MARRKRSRSGININPKNRGAFSRKGISVSQGLKSRNPKTRAQANFARMAKRHFKPLPSSGKKRSSSTKRTHAVRGHTRKVGNKRVRVRAHRRKSR